jgi:hypothetical protein
MYQRTWLWQSVLLVFSIILLLKQSKMENYNNKLQAIIGLQNKGYDLDFILKDENLLCLQEDELISPDEFEISETYRFAETHGCNETYVIYAIRSVHRDLKGILMTSYSAFNEGLGIHLWRKLSTTLREA